MEDNGKEERVGEGGEGGAMLGGERGKDLNSWGILKKRLILKKWSQ